MNERTLTFQAVYYKLGFSERYFYTKAIKSIDKVTHFRQFFDG